MPAFRLIYKLFVFHLLSEYMHYHCLLRCVSPADFDVSKTCQDRGLYACIGHIRRKIIALLKLILKFRTVIFLSIS